MKTKLAKILSLVLVCALVIGTCNVKAQAASSEGWTKSDAREYETVTVTVKDAYGPVSGLDVDITVVDTTILGHGKDKFTLTTDDNGVVVLHVHENYNYVDSVHVNSDKCHASENLNNLDDVIFVSNVGIHSWSYSYNVTLKNSHQVKDLTKVEATCTEDGYEAGKKCDKCGKVISGCEVIKALDHEFGEWSEILKDENGFYQERECDRHDLTERRDINYTEVPATCEEDGNYSYTLVEGGTVVSEGAIAATGHELGEWSEILEDEDGFYQERECTKCDYEERRALAYNTEDSDCTSEGSFEYVTKDGIVVSSGAIAATGHNFGEWYVENEATYEEDGNYRRDCQNEGCEEYETKVIDQLVDDSEDNDPVDEPKDEPKDEPAYVLPILPADYGKKNDEPATEEPVVEEPAAEEPVVEEPAAEEPVVEEPVVEEPVVEEPVEEEVIDDIEVVETAQGDVDDEEEEEEEEEDIDLDIMTTPQGDVLPQTGVASAALFLGLGAACIGFGGAIVAKARKKED